MKSRIILAAFSLVVFSACNSEAQSDNVETPVMEQQETGLTLNGDDPVNTMQLDGTPQDANSDQSVQTQATKESGKSIAGLNPEHGQPGHRCDIAVGAPLNSAPAEAPQMAPQQNANQPVMTPMPAPTASPAPTMGNPTNPNAKLNPAHGEPGHRCDIQVGAPLN